MVMILIGMIIPSLTMHYYDLPPVLSGRPMDIIYYIMHGNHFATMHLVIS